MKRIVLGLIVTAAWVVVMTPAEAKAQYYRPGVRVGVYGGYPVYPNYYRPYYYGPAYYPPPPAYYYPPPPAPVYAPPVIVPSFSFSFGGRR
jgi:hypothetical protein